MNPIIFYWFLISSIDLSILISNIIYYFSNWELNFPIIFIFIILFPISWKIWKKYFPRDKYQKWIRYNINSIISLVLLNIIFILSAILIQVSYWSIEKKIETSNNKYEKYFKDEPTSNTSSNLKFSEL